MALVATNNNVFQFKDPMQLDDSQIVFEFERAWIAEEEREAKEGATPEGICRMFLRGSCLRGKGCPWKHSGKEKSIVCKHWLRGLCKKGDLCEFLHQFQMDKMPECFFFSKFGACSNPDCIYRHISQESKMNECLYYQRGFCKNGPYCKNRHTRKVACAFYLQGFCADGPNCPFGHPKYEMPKMVEKENPNQHNELSDPNEQQHPAKRVKQGCFKCGSPDHRLANCPILAATTSQQPQQQQQYQQGQNQREPYKAQTIMTLADSQQQGQNRQAGGGGQQNKRPLSDVTCFKCGAKGHYSNSPDCPLKRKQQ